MLGNEHSFIKVDIISSYFTRIKYVQYPYWASDYITQASCNQVGVFKEEAGEEAETCIYGVKLKGYPTLQF